MSTVRRTPDSILIPKETSLVRDSNLNVNHFSDKKTGEYDKCHMYDLSGMMNKIRGPFSSAITQRPSELNLTACTGTDIPEAETWEFDTTEGIFSIVNDVSAVKSIH